MSLRQLQRKAAALISGDAPLLKALQSELSHELSHPPPPAPPQPLPSQVSDFEIEWDDARTQDVVLKRRDAKEEIAVSGLLGPTRFKGEDPIPRDVLMKVCVKKLGFEPVMHFDCKVLDNGFWIRNVWYHPKVGDLRENEYRGSIFSLLDPQLKKELKEYLVARGINAELTHFLLQHLHTREHNQYINWLRTLESFISKEEP